MDGSPGRFHRLLQPALVRLYGHDPGRDGGWGWRTVHDPTHVDAVLQRWQHSIDTGDPFEMEFPLRGADGIFQWFLTRVKPLHDAEGRIVRWFGSNTEYRRAAPQR